MVKDYKTENKLPIFDALKGNQGKTQIFAKHWEQWDKMTFVMCWKGASCGTWNVENLPESFNSVNSLRSCTLVWMRKIEKIPIFEMFMFQAYDN